MRLQRVLEIVHNRPWLITPSGHEVIRELLQTKLAPALAGDQRAGLLDDLMIGRPAPTIDDHGVGHLHVTGAIGVGFSKLEKTCGNTDTGDLVQEARDTIKAGARKLMMYFDSPGGMAGGTPEAADELANLDVPWFAYVGPGCMSCSASYWLSVGADRIYASETAEVGSIGVYMPWVDRTAAYEERGMKVELIKNKEGDLKGAGYPGTQLTAAQKEDWQKGCQQLFDMFSKFVCANRPGGISADTMRGQTFFATEARNRHLIDGVAPLAAAHRTLLTYNR
jgi:ClpP class serine protease